ncbi:hypothetical protein [Rhizobium phage RHph_X66]|nr:hypothetical protein [Rhizobium phage RHph_X66]
MSAPGDSARNRDLLCLTGQHGTQSGRGRVRLPWSGVGGDGVPEFAVENRGAAQYLLSTIPDFARPFAHSHLSTPGTHSHLTPGSLLGTSSL